MNNESLRKKAVLYSTIALVMSTVVPLAFFLLMALFYSDNAAALFLFLIVLPLSLIFGLIFACIGWTNTSEFLSKEQNSTVKRFNTINLSIIVVDAIIILVIFSLFTNWKGPY